MKRASLICLCLITSLVIGCKKKAPAIIPDLIVTGVADTVIVAPGTVLKYNADPFAFWSINKAAGGSLDSLGKFTAGSTDGVYRIKATNYYDATDTVIRTVIVTKHAAIFNGMKSGGYLLSFRHADAQTGADQIGSTVPNWWKSCDPTLARQITDPIGYKQSDSTGMVFKLLRLPFDTTMSSEFCRCKQTVQRFDLGVPNKEYPELTFSVYDESTRYAKTMNLYASRPITSKNYLSVTHAGYTTVPTPAPLATLNWGDCAVFKLNALGVQPTYLATITIGDWLNLARK